MNEQCRAPLRHQERPAAKCPRPPRPTYPIPCDCDVPTSSHQQPSHMRSVVQSVVDKARVRRRQNLVDTQRSEVELARLPRRELRGWRCSQETTCAASSSDRGELGDGPRPRRARELKPRPATPATPGADCNTDRIGVRSTTGSASPCLSGLWPVHLPPASVRACRAAARLPAQPAPCIDARTHRQHSHTAHPHS